MRNIKLATQEKSRDFLRSVNDELFPPSFHSDTSWRHFYSSTVM